MAYTAAILWTNDDGIEREEVADFGTESEARAWLADQAMHETSTKELWCGKRQLEV